MEEYALKALKINTFQLFLSYNLHQIHELPNYTKDNTKSQKGNYKEVIILLYISSIAVDKHKKWRNVE